MSYNIENNSGVIEYLTYIPKITINFKNLSIL